jgi:hypothetical protein
MAGMLRWITKTRLRTVLALLIAIFGPTLFVLVFGPIWKGIFPNSGPDNSSLSLKSDNVVIVTSITTVCATISTAILAWRADRRATEESRLKNLQLQQQIIELQKKLKPAEESPEYLG